MNKIVFLDRDGVINKYPGHQLYVDSLDRFSFLPGVKEAVAKLSHAGFLVFVISNQAGVSKGIYSQETLDDITAYMLKGFADQGAEIEKVLYCIHTDEDKCDCRKPMTGMPERVLREYAPVDKKHLFFVGDCIRDVKTGKGVGCTTILVLSGRQKIENKHKWESMPDFIVADLKEATEIILQKEQPQQ